MYVQNSVIDLGGNCKTNLVAVGNVICPMKPIQTQIWYENRILNVFAIALTYELAYCMRYAEHMALALYL